MKITTSAGHSYACDGAQGFGYSEHDQAVWLNNAFIALCQQYGVPVSNSTSEASTQNGYLAEQARLANNSGADLAIQWHFNAFNGSAHGTECLYYDAYDIAKRVSSAIASLGFTDRGPKQRTDLYWLNQTRMTAILIEVCFIDNRSDMDLYIAKRQQIVEKVFTAVTGIAVSGGGGSKPAEEAKVDCVIQCEPNLTDSQLWKFVKDGDYYKIVNKRGGCLDVIGGTDKGPMANERNVWTHRDNGTPAQRWKMVAGANADCFRLVNKIDENYCIDALHGPVAKRGYVRMHTLQTKDVDKWAQSWYKVPYYGGGDWFGLINAKSWYVLDANPTSIKL